MDTDGIRLFVLSADKLNISAAGRELGMAPAMASAKLAKLEKLLGSELLHRSTRKVSLSIEGEEFLPFAREIVAQEEAGLDAMGHGRSEPSGTLRFAASSTFAQLYIMPLLPKFLARFPAVNVDLRLSDTQFNLIEGSFDLALRNGSLADSSLKARKLSDDLRVLCASPSYLLAEGTPQKPADIAAHRVIGFQKLPQWPLVNSTGESFLFVSEKSQCRIVVDDGYSQKLATMAGGGIAINSLWSVYDELQRGELVRVLPDWSVDDNAAVWLVYPKTNVLTKKVRVLIDFLLEEIHQFPVWKDNAL